MLSDDMRKLLDTLCLPLDQWPPSELLLTVNPDARSRQVTLAGIQALFDYWNTPEYARRLTDDIRHEIDVYRRLGFIDDEDEDV